MPYRTLFMTETVGFRIGLLGFLTAACIFYFLYDYPPAKSNICLQRVDIVANKLSSKKYFFSYWHLFWQCWQHPHLTSTLTSFFSLILWNMLATMFSNCNPSFKVDVITFQQSGPEETIKNINLLQWSFINRYPH